MAMQSKLTACAIFLFNSARSPRHYSIVDGLLKNGFYHNPYHSIALNDADDATLMLAIDSLSSSRPDELLQALSGTYSTVSPAVAQVAASCTADVLRRFLIVRLRMCDTGDTGDTSEALLRDMLQVCPLYATVQSKAKQSKTCSAHVQVMGMDNLVCVLDATYRVPCMLTLQPLSIYDYRGYHCYMATAVFDDLKRGFTPALHQELIRRTTDAFHMNFGNSLQEKEDQLESGNAHVQVSAYLSPIVCLCYSYISNKWNTGSKVVRQRGLHLCKGGGQDLERSC